MEEGKKDEKCVDTLLTVICSRRKADTGPRLPISTQDFATRSRRAAPRTDMEEARVTLN